jgi:WD40 repeat protein/class 3 adenylate cyclase
VFTPGREEEEATQLWAQVEQDAPHQIAAFDGVWFARLLAERRAPSAPAQASSAPPARTSPQDRVLPEGLVTFLATDIEGSTQRWEQAPQAMQQALTRHHAIFHQLTELYGGQVFHTVGDSFICVFADAVAALQSALALQRALLAEPWPEAITPLRVRMALHSGAATTQGEGYVAEPTLNRLSRVLALSQGGQLLLTQATIDLIGARWPQGVRRQDLGVQQLRDVSVPLQLWQALAPDLPPPPTREQHSTLALSSTLVSGQRSVVDWGEAIAVPTLYGRERELGTLQRWVVDERCRVVALLGLGGIGKSSLAITLAHQVLAQFDAVLFRSLRNGPPLADVLDQTIRAVSDQQATPPEQLPDKIARLVQLLRERRCLLILDNFESILEPDALSGTYRSGYNDYGALILALSEREHQSCLLLTSREKPSELGLHEGRSAPVRALQLAGLEDYACQLILEAKDISGAAPTVSALARLYGGNPLALQLISEPIHELFGGDVGAFLATGDAFFNGVGQLLAQQFGRSTPLEQAILYWLAIEREPVPLSALLANLDQAVPQREVLVALESLRHRMLIERAATKPAFTLQPVILEYVSDQLVEAVHHELVAGSPQLLCSHALIQATAKDYVRHTQERLIARPLLERLLRAYDHVDALERQMLILLASWREQSSREQGYGPGNIINLLRLLRGDLRGLDLARLAIRQAYLAEVDAQDVRLVGAQLANTVLAEAFHFPSSVVLSGDGALLAAGTSTGEVCLWRVVDRTSLWAVQGHTGGAWSVALSSDGQLAASGGGDGMVRLWEADSGRLVATLQGHSGAVWSVALSSDGGLLASGGDDGMVRLWETITGRLVVTMQGHSDAIRGVALSSDGRLAASGGGDGTVRLWETDTGRPLATLQGHSGVVWDVAFSPDGGMIASGGGDGTVRLWETDTGRPLATLQGHSGVVWDVAFSPDGGMVASGGDDRTVRLWETSTGRPFATLQGHTGAIHGVALNSDGQLLASGSRDGSVRLWETDTGRPLATLQGHTSMVWSVALSTDGRLAASGGGDGALRLWETGSGRLVATLQGHAGAAWSVALSSDGQLVASGGDDKTVRLWETGSGRLVATLQGHTTAVGNVALSSDGRLAASGGGDGVLRLWETSSEQLLAALQGHTGTIVGVALSSDGELVASGSFDGTVRLWETSSGKPGAILQGHSGAIRCVSLSSDGRLVASGGDDGTVRLWEAETGRPVATWQGHTSTIGGVALSSDGRLVATGSLDGTVRLWEAGSGRSLATLQGHTSMVWSVALSADGQLVASGSFDGTVKLWEAQSGACLRTLRAERCYERMDISGLGGITAAQRASLIALGAVEAP